MNAQDDTQQSAYLIATSEGYYELLELTLRHGAQVEAKDSYNGTGLIRAAERGHCRRRRRLVRAGVPVDHVNNLGWTGAARVDHPRRRHASATSTPCASSSPRAPT